MGSAEWTSVAVGVMALIAGLVGYLLSSKDLSQQRAIEDLYEKHDIDIERLRVLELKVALDHPQKSEIRQMFDDMKRYFDAQFVRIESAISENTERRQ